MKLSVPKPTNKNAAAPSAKNGTLRLLDINFIKEMPPVDIYGIACLGDFTFTDDKEFQTLYLTPTTQKYEIMTDGDADSRLFRQKIFGTHPGNEIRIFEFIKRNINVAFVAIYQECGAEYSKIFGSPQNPLFIMPNFRDDKDGKATDISLEQNTADYTPILFYNDGAPIYVEETDHDKIFGPEFGQAFE